MEAEDEEENKGKRTCVPRQKKNLTNEELVASSAAKAHFLTKKSFQAFLLDALGPRRRLSAATVHQNGFAGPQCPCRCPRWSRIFPLEVCSVITRVRALGLMRVRQVGALHMDIRLVLLECIGVVVMFCAVHIRHGKKRKTVSHKLLTLSADFRAFTPKEARDHVYSCVM